MNAVKLYDQEHAAARVNVSVRTVQRWQADGWLRPVPCSRELFGRLMYSEEAVIRADRLAVQRAARAQRKRRRAVLGA